MMIHCQSVSYTIPSTESMNLDKIKILSANLLVATESSSVSKGDENSLTLDTGKGSKVTTDILIAYKADGMNLIADIKSGRVLEHKIILKNQKGEVLTSEPFAIDEIKAIEFFSQTLEFDKKNLPAVGEFVTVHLEMIYAVPYVDVACAKGGAPPCDKTRSILGSPSFDSPTLGKISNDQLDFKRNAIRSKISKINIDQSSELASPPGTQLKLNGPIHLGDANVLVYREWKLVSNPTYFKISAIVKNGQPIEVKKEEVFELPTLTNEVEEPNLFDPQKDKELPKERPFKRTSQPKKKRKVIEIPE